MNLAEPLRRRPWAAYPFAVAAGFCVAGGFILAPVFIQFPFLLPILAVTIVAFLCGRGPAIVTAVLSELYVQYDVVGQKHTFAVEWPAGYIGLGFYLFLCAVIISLMHGMFRATASAEASEASLRQLNDELEARVTARTADLVAARNALIETNQTLEARVEARVGDLRAANEEIQRFAYIVSHDLRAPLVNVLGFTSELDALRADLGPFLDAVEATAPHLVTAERRAAIARDLPEAIGFIRTSTQKMDRLINAILKLSREGRRKLAPEPIDVAALVAAQGATLAQQLSARNATLTVEGGLPPLVSDRLAIEQIFGNLIENAVKYLAADRAGRIVVTGRVDSAFLAYDIADNGRGIDAKDFERIFELFRRSGVQDTPGEGIGLAYVRNLVRRLGGNVTVRSDYGLGSTFTVTLPSVFQPPARTEPLEE